MKVFQNDFTYLFNTTNEFFHGCCYFTLIFTTEMSLLHRSEFCFVELWGFRLSLYFFNARRGRAIMKLCWQNFEFAWRKYANDVSSTFYPTAREYETKTVHVWIPMEKLSTKLIIFQINLVADLEFKNILKLLMSDEFCFESSDKVQRNKVID